MKIEILDAAEQDLIDGFEFYEHLSKGLGNYFLDSLFSDIESLHVYSGIYPSISDIIGYYLRENGVSPCHRTFESVEVGSSFSGWMQTRHCIQGKP